MSAQSEISQRIEIPPAYIGVDTHNHPVDFGARSGNDNNTRSENIEFDPVEIVGTPPQIIEMPPLEIIVPKTYSSAKESTASPDSRAVLSAPGRESKSQETTPQQDVTSTQADKATAQIPQEESTSIESNSYRRRWLPFPSVDGPSYATRYPDLVDMPKPSTVQRAKKAAGKKNEQSDPAATQSEPKRQQTPQELSPELAKSIVEKASSNKDLRRLIIGDPLGLFLARLPLGSYTGPFREFVMASISGVDEKISKIGSPKFPAPVYYDKNRPEVDAMICTGMHAMILEVLATDKPLSYAELLKIVENDMTGKDTRGKSPVKVNINGEYYNIRIVSRDGTYVPHQAIGIEIGNETYIIDWYFTMDLDNPMIFKEEDWQEDGTGVSYTEFLKQSSFDYQRVVSPRTR